MTTFSYSDLEQIWINNGGSAIFAPIAAAIAMAESGGNSDAVGSNSNGSVDRGLWQINSSNGALSTTDINGNAKAAVQMSNNGTNWKPWCTAYSDGACGTKGGTFLGAGAPYQKFLSGQSQVPQGNSSVNGQQPTSATLLASTSSNCQIGFTVPGPSFLPGPSGDKVCLWYDSWSRAAFGAVFFGLAGVLGIAGVAILMTRTKVGQQAVKIGKRVGVDALIAGIMA